MRTLLIVLLSLVLVPSALAGPIVERAATALANDPVYGDPQAEHALSAADERRLENEIEQQGKGPIYIAVLPDAAVAEGGGAALGVLDDLAKSVGGRGVCAVVAGDPFRAESTDLGPGKAGDLASNAFNAHRSEGVEAVLVDFVDRVGEQRSGGGGDGGGGGLLGRIGLFPILVVG